MRIKSIFRMQIGLTIVFVFFLTILMLPLRSNSAFAVGGRNNECEDAQIRGYDNGNEFSRSYTDSGGNLVTGVCIKAGERPFGDGHSDMLGNGNYDYLGNIVAENPCYTIVGVGTSTVTVIRHYDSNTCQGISHIDIYVAPVPTPSPTAFQLTPTPTTYIEPTAEPTSDPTNTPIPTYQPTPTCEPFPTCGPMPSGFPCPSCGPFPTCEPVPTCVSCNPTLTPTPVQEPTSTPVPTEKPTSVPEPTKLVTSTPEPTSAPEVTETPGIITEPTSAPEPTATPTPSDSNTGGSDVDSDTSSSTDSSESTKEASSDSEGKVLGASTLADTGGLDTTISDILFLIGIALLYLALSRYVQSSKNKK